MTTTRRGFVQASLAGWGGFGAAGFEAFGLGAKSKTADGRGRETMQVAATSFQYLHVDVFTDTPLTGNQLAVFLEPEGLSTEHTPVASRRVRAP